MRRDMTDEILGHEGIWASTAQGRCMNGVGGMMVLGGSDKELSVLS